MVVIKPIPKSLLPHTVTLQREVPKQDDFWEDDVLESNMVLSYVKLEPSNKIVRDKNNAEIQIAATLFYDCKNSEPRGITFEEDDVIIFNGEKHQVETVEPLYDRKKLHHYELGLIKRA